MTMTVRLCRRSLGAAANCAPRQAVMLHPFEFPWVESARIVRSAITQNGTPGSVARQGHHVEYGGVGFMALGL